VMVAPVEPKGASTKAPVIAEPAGS
jgi:hypothetical protein